MSFILLGILNSQAEAAGAANSYDLLETTLITSNTASVTFSNLGNYSSYKHLEIRYASRTDRVSEADRIRIRINSDSTTYASYETVVAMGSSYQNNVGTNLSYMDFEQGSAGNSTASNNFGVGIIHIPDFLSASKAKTAMGLTGLWGLSSPQGYMNYSGNFYDGVGAVSTLLIEKTGSNFVNGSRFSLYGIKG